MLYSYKLKDCSLESALQEIKRLQEHIDMIVNFYAGKDIDISLVEGNEFNAAVNCSYAVNDPAPKINACMEKLSDLMIKDGSKISQEEKTWFDSRINDFGRFDRKKGISKVVETYPGAEKLMFQDVAE